MNVQFEFIADDFGRDEQTNLAMVHSHQKGALSGVALMMGQASTCHAVALARENPKLKIGWHFHIVDSKPLTRASWPWQTPASAGFAIGFSRSARALVRAEVQAQWLAFKDTGLSCAFINAHHHMFIHPFIRKTVVDELRGEFSGWMRWARPRFFDKPQLAYKILDNLLQKPHIKNLPFRASDSLWGIDRTFRMESGEVRAKLEELAQHSRPGELHEFMFHPRVQGDADTRCLIALKEQWPSGIHWPIG
ncbi:putative glycoside hydrolase/deacetylase ChbG (UPF0249 family) [Alteromonadaceae bacterium 2753L.S.0a.02]|nr:putative glycoside hydrolase/deacetylase ChbG (UPF0249 family) [Alteromonadaceae bacterium 2753L.S.0a.02]